MKIVVVTTHTPLPWEDGAGAYLTSIVNYFGEEGHSVELVWLCPHDRIRWKRFWRMPVRFANNVRLVMPGSIRIGAWYVFPDVILLPAKARALSRIKKLLGVFGIKVGKPKLEVDKGRSAETAPNAQWRAYPTDEQIRFVADILRVNPPDVLIANYPWMSPILRLDDHVRRVILCYDVQHERAYLSGPEEAARYTREHEQRDLSLAQELWAISNEDAASIKQLATEANVKVASMAIETKLLNRRNEIRGRCLFVGSDNTFNREGVEWLLREVWPLILEKAPHATLEICGAVTMDLDDRLADAVVFSGPVPDLRPHYENAEVVVIPLKSGSGVKIKVLEAASYGKAIVGTSVAFQSLHNLLELCTAVDHAKDFSVRVVNLLESPDQRVALGCSLMSVVESQYSPKACYGGLLGDTTMSPDPSTVKR